MRASSGGVRTLAIAALGIAAALTCFIGAGECAEAPPPAQKRFSSPEEAAAALTAAAKAGDSKALLEVLGPDAADIVDSGDKVADQNALKRFVASYEKKHALEPSGDAKMTLATGEDDWPFPIPLVKEADGWRFDTAQGKEELIDRRIGRNELSAIEVARAYVDAQREYHERNPLGEPLPQYAQKVASTEGKRDGLFWVAKQGEPPSPLGPLVAAARGEGYAEAGKGKGIPYHGYYYHVLTAQGPDAKGGAYDYMAHGKMIGGFALVAYPADYGSSGVMTFLVNHDGVVFQKDLGPDTTEEVKAMKTFNPDSTWEKVS
jgi:hypothetical protein